MINYELSKGLEIQKRVFGVTPLVETFKIEGTAFEPLDELNDKGLITGIRSCKDSPVITYSDKQSLVTLNCDRGYRNSVLFGMSWGANFEHPIGEDMVACVAKRFSESNIISWNAFNRGSANFSSKHQRSSLKHGLKTGSYSQIGRDYANQLNQVISTNQQYIDLIGVSEGGRVVLAMVPYLDRPVRNVILLDSPGTLDTGIRGMSQGFKDEVPHSQEYIKHSHDPRVVEFLKVHNSAVTRGKNMLKDIKRGGAFDHYVRTPKILAKRDGLSMDLDLALPYIVGKFAFILPTFTEVNDPDKVRHDLEVAAKKHYRKEVELWEFAGTHAVINAGNMVESTLLEFVAKH